MSSRAIDLPASPYRSTAAEGELLDAPVVATLMQGKTIAGRLAGLDGPRAIVTLQTKGKGRAYVRFSELRYLNFITRNPINRGRHPLQQEHASGTVMPKASQEFRITFADQKILTGRTRGSFVDKVGIHLFQLVDNAHVSRLFIPSQAVQKYYIGQRRTTEASPGEESQATAPAPTPHRRKSDRARKRAAADSRSLQQALTECSTDAEGLAGARRIGEMLVEDGVISEAQLDAALQAQGSLPVTRIGEILVRMGMASPEQIHTVLAHKFGMPFVLLRNFLIDIGCISLVPADIARRYSLVPLLIHKDRLVVAMDDPGNTEALTLLRFMTQYHIEPTIATPDDLQWAIRKYYGGPHPASGASAPATQREERNRETTVRAVTSFIGKTIADAIERGAADIEIVPERHHADLVFRIGGTLMPVRRFSRVIMPAIVERLRQMADLPSPRDALPQSGRARVLNGDSIIDVQIRIGGKEAAAEGALLRIIDAGSRLTGLRGLLPAADCSAVEQALARRKGLLIVSGPPNAHRSRTLYAALREIQRPGRRVMTADVPSYFHVAGMEQMHPTPGELEGEFLDRVRIAAKENRLDGILLGDIGGAAILDAALACAEGAVVLGRLTAPTAAQALTRLAELSAGRDPTDHNVLGVLAQQPALINCRFCLEEETVGSAERTALGVGPEEVFYHGAGCRECGSSGHAGRQLVFEFLPMSAAMAARLREERHATGIHHQAVADGMVPIASYALELARLRRIPFAEAWRLSRQTRL